jgi:hypothetical protein
MIPCLADLLGPRIYRLRNERRMNHEFNEEERRTKLGTVLERELPDRLLSNLGRKDTPQKSKDVATAFNKHVLEIEAALGLLARARLVQYRPIERVYGAGSHWTPKS